MATTGTQAAGGEALDAGLQLVVPGKSLPAVRGDVPPAAEGPAPVAQEDARATGEDSPSCC